MKEYKGRLNQKEAGFCIAKPASDFQTACLITGTGNFDDVETSELVAFHNLVVALIIRPHSTHADFFDVVFCSVSKKTARRRYGMTTLVAG